jgi:hypothetical protein
MFRPHEATSGNYQLEEIITLHGRTRQYDHVVPARRRIRNVRSHFPRAIFMYGVHVVFLVRDLLCQVCVPYIESCLMMAFRGRNM